LRSTNRARVSFFATGADQIDGDIQDAVGLQNLLADPFRPLFDPLADFWVNGLPYRDALDNGFKIGNGIRM
jgi:hypothetical protein